MIGDWRPEALDRKSGIAIRLRGFDIVPDLYPTRWDGRFVVRDLRDFDSWAAAWRGQKEAAMEDGRNGVSKEWTGAAQSIADQAKAGDESESDYRVRRLVNRLLDERKTGAEAITLENVAEVFQYQPWSAAQQECGDAVRDALVMAAKQILRSVPPGAYRTRVLTMLVDARMVANAAITFRGRF